MIPKCRHQRRDIDRALEKRKSDSGHWWDARGPDLGLSIVDLKTPTPSLCRGILATRFDIQSRLMARISLVQQALKHVRYSRCPRSFQSHADRSILHCRYCRYAHTKTILCQILDDILKHIDLDHFSFVKQDLLKWLASSLAMRATNKS